VTRCHIPDEKNRQLHYCENLKYSPTVIHLHHFTIKCTPLPKFSLQFFDYFLTVFQPYKRITWHVKMVSIYNLEIAVMSHLNILPRRILKVVKNKQKKMFRQQHYL
jgi:hypothetical protein